MLPFEGWVADSVRDALAAIDDEIAATAGQESEAELRDGRAVGLSGPTHLWSFEVDREIAPAPDTPAALIISDGSRLPARVWAVGDDTIVLGLGDRLDGPVRQARLSLDTAFLLHALRDRIESRAQNGESGELLAQFLDPTAPPPDSSDGPRAAAARPLDADAEQERAARRAIEPGLRFTWGPPGTGKTRVLAMAVAEAMAAHRKVLVLAHSNAAVDVALARIADTLDERRSIEGESGLPPQRPGEVVRLGTPTPTLADTHPQLIPELIVAAGRPELGARIAELRTERSRISDELRTAQTENHTSLKDRLANIRSEIAELWQRVRAETRELIEQADVIGATLASSTISDTVWDFPADVIIVDEASMAGVPYVLELAMREASTLSCFGDFRQLPPIALATTGRGAQWFSEDVFAFCEVRARHEQGIPDERLTVLRVQFRMGEQICETVNHLAYGGLLRTHPTALRRGIRLAEAEPGASHEVVIVDLAGIGTECFQEANPNRFSRVNLLSAAVSLTTAALMLEDLPGIGVLSPYRAQTQVLGAAARGHSGLTAATIHRFQGAERDGVVLDLTDAYDQDGASRLTGTDGELALRLLNVAASRARGKLVVVADVDFLLDRHSHASISRKLVEHIDSFGIRVPAAELIRQADHLAQPDRLVEWTTWEGAITECVAALDDVASVEVNLGGLDASPSWVWPLVARAGSASLTVHGAHRAIKPLEEIRATLRLKPVGLAPWVAAGDHLIVGSTIEEGPVAMWRSARVERTVAALRRLGD